MDDSKKVEIIQKIINSKKIVAGRVENVDKTKVWYIQTLLSGYFTEEDIAWIWSED